MSAFNLTSKLLFMILDKYEVGFNNLNKILLLFHR